MIRTTEALDLLVLSTGMRKIQKHAMNGVTPDGNRADAMRRLWDAKPLVASVVNAQGNLIGVLGALIIHPGVASSFMYTTEDFGKHVLEFSHLWRDTFVPLLKKHGVHRIHAMGLAQDERGNKWKEKVLGFTREATLTKWGITGDDYVLHVLFP